MDEPGKKFQITINLYILIHLILLKPNQWNEGIWWSRVQQKYTKKVWKNIQNMPWAEVVISG